MKRYLIGKMYTEKDFLEYDNESYCDINFQMLVAILLKKMKSKMQTASKTIKGISGMRDFLAQLENMPFSLEYMFDIWNEIFLKLLYISNEKEKLFPEEKKISIYLEEAERVFCNAQLIENMESTINNRKKQMQQKKIIFLIWKILNLRKRISK